MEATLRRSGGSVLAATTLVLCLACLSFAQSAQPNKAPVAKQETPSKDAPQGKDTVSDNKPNTDNKPDTEWLETFVGQVVSVNPSTQRIIIKSLKNGRTKLINFTKETVIKKGDQQVLLNELKLGKNVMIKYDLLESNARVISLLDENSTKD